MSDHDQRMKELAIEEAIVAARIEAMAMEAANHERKARGHALAYDDVLFFEVIERMHQRILKIDKNFLAD